MDLWTYLTNKGYSKQAAYYVCDKIKNGFSKDENIMFNKIYWSDVNDWKNIYHTSDIGI